MSANYLECLGDPQEYSWRSREWRRLRILELGDPVLLSYPLDFLIRSPQTNSVKRASLIHRTRFLSRVQTNIVNSKIYLENANLIPTIISGESKCSCRDAAGLTC